MQAYCVRCKDKRDMQQAKQVTSKNGRQMMKGTCGDCQTTLNKFLPSGGKKLQKK